MKVVEEHKEEREEQRLGKLYAWALGHLARKLGAAAVARMGGRSRGRCGSDCVAANLYPCFGKNWEFSDRDPV